MNTKAVVIISQLTCKLYEQSVNPLVANQRCLMDVLITHLVDGQSSTVFFMAAVFFPESTLP